MYYYWKELKTLWQKEKLLIISNLTVSHYVFKSCLLQMFQNMSLGGKKLIVLPVLHYPMYTKGPLAPSSFHCALACWYATHTCIPLHTLILLFMILMLFQKGIFIFSNISPQWYVLFNPIPHIDKYYNNQFLILPQFSTIFCNYIKDFSYCLDVFKVRETIK